MSVASPHVSKKYTVITNKKNDETEKTESKNEKKEQLPAMKTYAQSSEHSQINDEWRSEKISSVANDQGHDGAASESEARSLTTNPTPTTLTATTTTTTTTTTTNTTTNTTTTTTAPQKPVTRLQSIDTEDPASYESDMESRVDFSSLDSEESFAVFKNFLADTERNKLTISYQTKEGMRNLQNCLFACATGNVTAVPNKEIHVEMGVRLDYDTINLLSELVFSMGQSGLVNQISLKGDDVLRTHPRMKYLLEKNPNIQTLQISGVKSDTVCQTFKIWTEYEHVPSIKMTSGLKIRRLCFAALKISDAAVFGSALRDLIAKTPNIKTVDFSQTPLSAEQKETLRFQLEPLGRPDLLEF